MVLASVTIMLLIAEGSQCAPSTSSSSSGTMPQTSGTALAALYGRPAHLTRVPGASPHPHARALEHTAGDATPVEVIVLLGTSSSSSSSSSACEAELVELLHSGDEDATRPEFVATVEARYGALCGVTARLSPAALDFVRALPDVSLAQFDERVVTVQAAQVTYGDQWALDRIDQRYLPLNQEYEYDASGTGVDVYVIDSGASLACTLDVLFCGSHMNLSFPTRCEA